MAATVKDATGSTAAWPEWLPTVTPWGSADFVTIIADGIAQVDTPSHGGIFLRDDKLEEIPLMTQKAKAQKGYTPPNWFEEDCEVVFVFDHWPELFPRFFSIDDPRAVISSIRNQYGILGGAS